MIGWLILLAVLVPALVLGRWAEHERRRLLAQQREPPGPAVVPVHVAPRRRRVHAGQWVGPASRPGVRVRVASRPSPRARA